MGSGGSPPVARAGLDQTVYENAVVTLDGSASSDPDLDVLTYRWTQISGQTVAPDSFDNKTMSFTAPDVEISGMVLVFQLTVTDTSQYTSTDQVTVTVNWVDQAPEANAGADITVKEGEGVTLSGSLSTDPDDGIASYSWVQTAGPDVTLIDSQSEFVSFTSPDVGPQGEALTFELTVSDTAGMISTDTVIVNVTWENQPPVAIAGNDLTVTEGDAVVLDGSQSYDNDDGLKTWSWAQNKGPAVVLTGAQTATPNFVAPATTDNGVVIGFELTVEDQAGLKATDDITVSVGDKQDTIVAGNCLFTYSLDQGGQIESFQTVSPETLSRTSQAPDLWRYDPLDIRIRMQTRESPARVSITLNQAIQGNDKWYVLDSSGVWQAFDRSDTVSAAALMDDSIQYRPDDKRVEMFITDNGMFDQDQTPDQVRVVAGLGLDGETVVDQNDNGNAGCFLSTLANF